MVALGAFDEAAQVAVACVVAHHPLGCVGSCVFQCCATVHAGRAFHGSLIQRGFDYFDCHRYCPNPALERTPGLRFSVVRRLSPRRLSALRYAAAGGAYTSTHFLSWSMMPWRSHFSRPSLAWWMYRRSDSLRGEHQHSAPAVCSGSGCPTGITCICCSCGITSHFSEPGFRVSVASDPSREPGR